MSQAAERSAAVSGLSPPATALVTVLAFAAGIGIQPFARRMEDRRPRAGVLAGLACGAAGAGIGAAAVATAFGPALADLAAVFFGLAYGLCLVSGLRQAEHLAGERDRGAFLASYYVLAYLGFAAPYVAEALNTVLGQPGTFDLLGALAAVAAALIAAGGTRRSTPHTLEYADIVVFTRTR